MRKWGSLAGVAIVAAIAFSLGRATWPVDPRHVATDLSFALQAADLPLVEAPRKATLTFLPRPTLHIEGLSLRAAGGAFEARAARADAPLRFDRLLVGQLAIASLSLQDADIRLDLDAARVAMTALARSPVPRLSIERGLVAVASQQQGWANRFEVAAARIDWPKAESALRLSATGRWREQPVEASLELSAPLSAARGGPSALKASLAAPLAQLVFAGDVSSGRELEGDRAYRGRLTALVPSVERFSRWIGQPAAALPASLELEARASGDASKLQLADARLTLGGQLFEGSLDLDKTIEGLAASGTLAADKLDLDPLIGPPPALFDAAGEWSKAPVLPAASRRFDLDLRVSATRASWGGYAFDAAAAAVSQRAGALSVKLLEANFAHGSLGGEISVEERAGICESRLALTLENADFGALLGDLDLSNFVGHGVLKASVRAHGRAPADIVATADGDGSLEVADGELLNLNFEEALRRGQRRTLDMARDMNAGPTRFLSARARLEISDGEARFVDAKTLSPGVSLALTGAIDLKARVWRASLAARQSALDGEPNPDGAHIDFALVGPWSAPMLAPIVPPAD